MSQEIVWNVPENLYRELVWAQQELAYPNLVDFIGQAVLRRLADLKAEAWQRDLSRLQKQIHASGGFGLGETKEEIIANLRHIRNEIVEKEYAE